MTLRGKKRSLIHISDKGARSDRLSIAPATLDSRPHAGPPAIMRSTRRFARGVSF